MPQGSVIAGDLSIVASHGAWHRLAMQTSPVLQAMPQPPQFLASESMAAQLAPHTLWPCGQLTHAPAPHVSPAPHACPHAPQLSWLLWRSTSGGHDAPLPHPAGIHSRHTTMVTTPGDRMARSVLKVCQLIAQDRSN